MHPTLSYAVAAFLGLVALLAVGGIVWPRLEQPARAAMRVGQLAALVVVVLDVVTLLQGHDVDSRVTHIGYAVAAAGLPVILLTRQPEEGQEEAEPAHLGVVAVTAAAMAVLVVRLHQTW